MKHQQIWDSIQWCINSAIWGSKVRNIWGLTKIVGLLSNDHRLDVSQNKGHDRSGKHFNRDAPHRMVFAFFFGLCTTWSFGITPHRQRPQRNDKIQGSRKSNALIICWCVMFFKTSSWCVFVAARGRAPKNRLEQKSYAGDKSSSQKFTWRVNSREGATSEKHRWFRNHRIITRLVVFPIIYDGFFTSQVGDVPGTWNLFSKNIRG